MIESTVTHNHNDGFVDWKAQKSWCGPGQRAVLPVRALIVSISEGHVRVHHVTGKPREYDLRAGDYIWISDGKILENLSEGPFVAVFLEAKAALTWAGF